MDLALREAQDAFTRGDWPVGSVLVRDGVVLATGQNRQNTERDVTWHAEFEAMRKATRDHGVESLAGATVYSTMEPCPMCAGAMKMAKIARLVLLIIFAILLVVILVSIAKGQTSNRTSWHEHHQVASVWNPGSNLLAETKPDFRG